MVKPTRYFIILQNEHGTLNPSICVENLNENFESPEKRLFRLILEDGLPLSFLESKNFRRFLFQLNSKISIPSRRHFTSKILPEIILESQNKILKISEKAEYVSLTVDTWISLANDSYFGITVHMIDINCKNISFLLSISLLSERHTSNNLSGKFILEMEKWNLNSKYVSVVHDSAANIRKAMDSSVGNNLKCLAHLIQLCVMKSLKIEHFQKNLKIIRSVIGHFKHSSNY